MELNKPSRSPCWRSTLPQSVKFRQSTCVICIFPLGFRGAAFLPEPQHVVRVVATPMFALALVITDMLCNLLIGHSHLDAFTPPHHVIGGTRLGIRDHPAIGTLSAELHFRRVAQLVGRNQFHDLDWLGEEFAVCIPALKGPDYSPVAASPENCAPNLMIRLSQGLAEDRRRFL